jgi:hypothetical protein
MLKPSTGCGIACPPIKKGSPMKRTILLISAFFVMTISLANFNFASFDLKPQIAQQKAEELARQKALRRTNFEHTATMLYEKGVPFDPYLLLEDDWPQRLKPALDRMPEMQEVRYHPEPLRGVHFADTLYLPERVELSGDTVIVAKKVVFEGENVLIKGNYSITFLPMQKVGVLGGPLPEQLRSKLGGPSRASIRIDQLKPADIPRVRSGRITIDTSGRGYEDWLASIGGEKTLKSVIKNLYSPDKDVRENALREFNRLRQGNTKISKSTGNTRQQRAAFTPINVSSVVLGKSLPIKYPGVANVRKPIVTLQDTSGGQGAMGEPGDPGTPSSPPNPFAQPKAPNGACSFDSQWYPRDYGCKRDTRWRGWNWETRGIGRKCIITKFDIYP